MLLDLWPALIEALTPAAPSQPGASNLPRYPRPKPKQVEYWGFTEPAEAGCGAEVGVHWPVYVGSAAADADLAAWADLLLPPPPVFAIAGSALAQASVRAMVGARHGPLTPDEITLLLLDEL